jgi:hypothetical protein
VISLGLWRVGGRDAGCLRPGPLVGNGNPGPNFMAYAPNSAGRNIGGHAASAFAPTCAHFAPARLLENPAGVAAASGVRLKLLVYLHVAVKQRAFQGLLRAALPGVESAAVGRIGDFERALAEGQDAVLTLPVVLEARGMKPGLRGTRQGAPDERYALVGDGAAPPSSVGSIGAIDLLGRDGTLSFVRRIAETPARVERVTKVEDLLPLLQMRRVEAVLSPLRTVADLQSNSRLPLVARELATRVGLPAASAVGSEGRAVLARLTGLPADISKMLGIDGWR